MTTAYAEAQTLLTAIAASSALTTLCTSYFGGTAHQQYFLGHDQADPPTEARCPMFVVAPQDSGLSADLVMRESTVGVHVVITDETKDASGTTNITVKLDGISKINTIIDLVADIVIASLGARMISINPSQFEIAVPFFGAGFTVRIASER
jgi:hypothetical protein